MNGRYNAGHTIHIVGSGKNTCHVTITRRYLRLLPEDLDQHIKYVDYRGDASVIILTNIVFLIPDPVDIFLEALETVISDISGYGTHSLKRGAATIAVRNGKVSPRQIDLHAG